MTSRVGDVQVSDVLAVAVDPPVDGNGKERLTFHRTGPAAPPEIAVPGKYRVIASGVDFGVRDVCCTGRHPRPGGFLSISWRV